MTLSPVNKTNTKNKDKIKLDGYTGYDRYRKNAAMGGIATAIKDKHSLNVLKVCECNKVEFIIVRLGQSQLAISVIYMHGPQESRLNIDDINEEWEELLTDIVN